MDHLADTSSSASDSGTDPGTATATVTSPEPQVDLVAAYNLVSDIAAVDPTVLDDEEDEGTKIFEYLRSIADVDSTESDDSDTSDNELEDSLKDFKHSQAHPGEMSWAGFKKNVNRATTQVMMKTGWSLESTHFTSQH